VNGFVISLAWAALFTFVIDAHVFDSLGGRVMGALIVLVLPLTITLIVWQCVGIWRSAQKHVSRGGRRGWAIAAQVAIIIGTVRVLGECIQYVPAMTQGFRLVLGADPLPAANLTILKEGKEVEVRGGLRYGTTDALRHVLDGTPTIQVVELNSLGGYLSEGEHIGQLISERGLTTSTMHQCVSACVLAFMGGNARYLGVHGRLGFHQASISGVGGGAIGNHGTGRFRRDLLERGVSESFVEQAMATPASTMWYPTADELLQAHVITSVVE
jgi:hypothetical protein